MNNLEAQFQPLLDLFAGKPYLQALAVALVAFFIAWFLTGVLKYVLKKIVARTRFTADDQFAEIIRPPLFYSLQMIGLSIAVRVLPWSDKTESLVMSILQTISVLIWMVFAIRFARILLYSAARRKKPFKYVQTQTLPLFNNTVTAIAVAVAIYLIFNAWGVDMTAWLASAGVVGIAVGFAAKDTLANFISGVFILTDAPYKIGDYVVLDTGERGEITHIGIRSTRMLTRDDVELTIPNSIMGNSKIVNESGGPYEKFRIRLPVGVAYGSDVAQVRKALMDVAVLNDKVCDSPEPRVRFRAFGGSSLDFELLCWVEQPWMRGQVMDTMLEAVYNRFNAEGIEIPFSQHDVYIKSLPAAPDDAST